MATYTEPDLPLEFLIGEEEEGQASREVLTLVSGSGALKSGRVLGKITTGGKLAPYDNTASNGTEVAFAILAYDADATAADVQATTFVRLCAVKAAKLGWGTNDATGITAGLADLATKYIIAR